MDLSHLHALELKLSHERDYLSREKTEGGRELRRVWIAQIEREISGERALLGLPTDDVMAIDDDALLNELMG